MKRRIDYWYDRVDLNRKLMKQLQIPWKIEEGEDE